MKTINTFITERLKLSKDTKVINKHNFDKIFDYVWVLLGFDLNVKNLNIYKPHTYAIRNWINKYNVDINDIDETFLCTDKGPEKWYQNTKADIEKYLGKDVAENFVFSRLDYGSIKIFKDYDVTVEKIDNHFAFVYNKYGIMFRCNTSPAFAYVITLKE